MDFSITSENEALRHKTRAFISESVMPLESDSANYDDYENIRLDILETVRDKAKKAGLWSPQAPKSFGGMGLTFVEKAIMYEEANRSIFGPVSLNCAAPDDGNIDLLVKIGTESQKKWWLEPLIKGEVRSAFAMTEPHPGGGSDPSMIQTTATKSGNVWRIVGKKWFITGGRGCKSFCSSCKDFR